MPGSAGLSVTEEECVWAMDCFHQQYLLITAVLTVAGDHSPIAFGDMSRRIWEVTVQNDTLWCVEGQGRKLSYYQPPLVKDKAGFRKEHSSCLRKEGMYEKPWSLSEEGHATEMAVPKSKASPWHHEVLIWKDSGCVFRRLKYNFLIQWWWRAEKNLLHSTENGRNNIMHEVW